MKLGFSTVMYEESGFNYPEIISRAPTLGYEGIELNFKVWPSQLNLDEIRESLKKFDVEVGAIGTRHLYVTHGLYLASPKGDVRAKTFIYITECMKMARKMGCTIVQLGWAFQGSRLETDYNSAWRQAVESLKIIGKLAREYGVRFVIEFACRKNAELINTMDDALRMLEEVGSENILVMADVFHIFEENDSLRETVLKAGKRLGYVHLSDSNRLTPGKGKLNLREHINALKEINYDGYLTMEFDAGSSPDESLREAAKHLMNFL